MDFGANKLKGLSTIFHHKKWVFAYVIAGLSFWQFDQAGAVQIISILIPVTIGASSFDKSEWRKSD